MSKVRAHFYNAHGSEVLEDSVIKRRSSLGRFSAIGIGLSAAWLALACGNDNNQGPDDDGTVVDPPPGKVDECKDNEFLEDCPGAKGPEGTGGTGGVDTKPDPVETTPKTAAELAKEAAQNILKSNCGSCHGTQLNEQNRQGGMNYINDMEELAKNGKIVPLNADESKIIIRMRNGSMPPTGQRVPDSDIDVVANYINNEDYWPDVPKAVCTDNPPLNFDELYRAVAEDLSDADAEDAPFLRYISIQNRAAAGVCTDTALDLDRQGLVKLVNMLSIDPTVVKPEPVDKASTLFRVDIRDPQWDRQITVDGTTFDDVWEAMVAANDYAVPFEGDDADDARADAQTDVPVMFLDSMLNVGAIGNLYYAIIDVDVAQTLDTFVSDKLLIDVQANLDDEKLIRAGTTKSRISRQDRLVEGHRIEQRPGFYYQSFDFDDKANESIFQDPFGFNEGGREAIFTLPNGMLAYLIADADANLVEDSNILLDSNQGNFRAITSVSCSNCHVGGLIPVVDEVRDVVRRNAVTFIQDGTLNQDQLEQLSEVYLDPDEFKQQVEEDSQNFYLNALKQANLPVSGAEPVSTVFFRFDKDMTLRDASSYLGVSADELERDLNLLDPALGVLERSGTVDRDDFTALYLESLCILGEVNRNRPADAECATVGQ
jgi:mono/diheme cytochrome c family protein